MFYVYWRRVGGLYEKFMSDRSYENKRNVKKKKNRGCTRM